MSGKAVGWAMDQVTGSPVTKLVLLKLADNANDNGVAYPSLNLIVSHTELSKRTVIDHLEKLAKKEDGGLNLIVIERGEADGQHFVNRYFLNLKNDPEFDPLKRNGEPKRALHHKISAAPQVIVETFAGTPEASLSGTMGGSVAATPLVQPTHDDVVSQLHQGSAADARGSVADAGGSVADANPPAPPIEINPQSNPQREPTQNAGARDAAPVVEKPNGKIPEFLIRDPHEQFLAAVDWHASTNRSDVSQAFLNIVVPGVTWPELAAAAKRYAAHLAGKNAKRRKDDPAPAVAAQTFIRKRMWEDYPETTVEAAVRLQPLQERPWGAHPAGAWLLEQLGPEKFDVWMRPCTLTMIEGIPVLTAPSALIRNRLATEYIDQLERAFARPVVLQ